MNIQTPLLLLVSLSFTIYCNGQQSLPSPDYDTGSTPEIFSKYLINLSKKTSQLNRKLARKSETLLHRNKMLEARIERRFRRKDSIKARVIFGDAKTKYEELQKKVKRGGNLQKNIPVLDSMIISLNFFDQNQGILSKVKEANHKLIEAKNSVQSLSAQFKKAEDIKAYLIERKQYLKEQLIHTVLGRQIKKLNRQAYYYNEQINEYKEIFSDRHEIEKKALELLGKTRLFKDFVNRNSQFAELFSGQSGMPNNSAPQTGFAALQTRIQVSSFIQQTLLGVAGASSQIQQSIQSAQSQVNDMRSRIYDLTGRNGSNVEIPDFKPNTQKTKSFGKRLEYGINFQSQKSTYLFPATSDIGLSIGYKLNDKSIVGVGASYKVGWGAGWRHISVSHQGAGARSYIEWKLKAGFGFSGGYEMIFRNWPNASVIPPPGGWKYQESGLIGLYKSISLKTKFFKKTKLQLLWDFLSYRQFPETPPILFRIGYVF